MLDFLDSVPSILPGAFIFTLVLFLVVDLGFMHRKPKKISTKSAAWQSLFWVVVSLLYGLLIWYEGKPNPGSYLEYFSTYVTEKSLSMDNIFVILLIFRYFKVDERYYHRILFWGILGAVVSRAVFIFAGAALVEHFEWVLYIFGIFLLYSGLKIFFEKDGHDFNPEQSPVVRFVRRYFSVSTQTEGGRFFVRENGKRVMTLLFLVLLLIEFTDLIFAVDSIPAAFAITQDEFVIYTSNIFAIMGLRAMFFLVSGIIDKFHLLQKGLAFILSFIGVKMLIKEWYHIETNISFIVILLTLGLSLLLSLMIKKKPAQETSGQLTQ